MLLQIQCLVANVFTRNKDRIWMKSKITKNILSFFFKSLTTVRQIKTRQETNTRISKHDRADKDSSTKTLRKEWKRHFLSNRQHDASLITLTSCICNPMITPDLLMSFNWLLVININQWPAGKGILDLLDLPDNSPMEK